MRYLIALLLLSACLSGCRSGNATAETETPAGTTQLPPGQGGGTGGITPMTPSGGAIPNAPVSGSDSVLGAGGGAPGVGSAMKSRARDMAAGGAPSSMDQMDPGDGEEDDGM